MIEKKNKISSLKISQASINEEYVNSIIDFIVEDIIDEIWNFTHKGENAEKEGNYNQAISNYKKSIELAEKYSIDEDLVSKTYLISSAYKSIGDLYLEIDNYDKALRYYNEYISRYIPITLNNSQIEKYYNRAIYNSNSIGLITIDNKSFDLEMIYYNALFFNARGCARYKIKDFENAINNHTEAIRWYKIGEELLKYNQTKKENHETSLATSYFNRYQCHLEINSYEEALEDINLCLQYSSEQASEKDHNYNPYRITNILEFRGDLYYKLENKVRAKEDYQLALIFYQKAQEVWKDSIESLKESIDRVINKIKVIEI